MPEAGKGPLLLLWELLSKETQGNLKKHMETPWDSHVKQGRIPIIPGLLVGRTTEIILEEL